MVASILSNCQKQKTPYPPVAHTSKARCSHPLSPCLNSDHLQLLKFWPSCARGRGSAAGRKFFTPPYYSQRAVNASLSAFSFSECVAPKNVGPNRQLYSSLNNHKSGLNSVV